jgi:hypothetical protein
MNTDAGVETIPAGTAKRAKSGIRARALRIGTAAILTGITSFAAVTMAGAGAAGAATIDGSATITDPSLAALSYPAASSTLFAISTPAGAACTGNTAGDGTKVYSYLVPYGTNVQNLTISAGHVSTGFAIFDYTGTPIESLQVASNNSVPTLSNQLDWEPFVTSTVLSSLLTGSAGHTGVWEAGILCANSTSHVTDYWNTEITFSADSNDPSGFTWSAVSGDPNSGANPEVPYAIILPVLGAAIVGGTLLIRRRRAATQAV